MNDLEMNVELAKLDGCEWNVKCVGINLFATQLSHPPEGVGFVPELKCYGDQRLATADEIESALNRADLGRQFGYLNFRDDIVRVIAKQNWSIAIKIVPFLMECVNTDGTQTKTLSCMDITRMVCATPRQLSESLLKAANKWK